MSSIKNKILCAVFSLISIMNFCAQIEQQKQLVTQESKSINSYIKHYVFLKVRSLGFKLFYNYLDSMIVDYKKNHLINYKVGMSYISGRYIFQDINQLHGGQTILHQAVASRNYHAMKMLLFFGAEAQVANQEGVTSYDLASRDKEPSYLQLFDEYKKLQKKRVDLDAQTMSQKYYVKMMHKLATLQSLDKQVLEFIINSIDDYKNRHPFLTSIFLYVIDGKCIDDFINVTDTDLTLLQHCIHDNNIDLAQILLYFGADPMLKNQFGISAFELALKNKNIQFLKLFWPYVGCDALRPEMYPLMVGYKDELVECVSQQGSVNFKNAVYHYFGMQNIDEQDHTPGMIVDFWN